MNKIFQFLIFMLLSLNVLAKKYDTVKTGMCTDVHLSTMHNSEYRITTFIDAMKREKPHFIIELGYPEELKKYMRSEISKWNLRFRLKRYGTEQTFRTQG